MVTLNTPSSLTISGEAEAERIAERFADKVQRPSSSAACWTWRGHKDAKGYGQVKIRGRAHWAHRVSYALFRGPVPAGKLVHHRCGNPSCVNPEHLELATPAENAAAEYQEDR